MSHQWGLDLSMTAIRLLRREAGHWQEIAAEAIDSADIEERITRLIAPIDKSQPVDLFLPKDQILYTDIDIADAAKATETISQALSERTPYAPDEIAFDWEQLFARSTQKGFRTVNSQWRRTTSERVASSNHTIMPHSTAIIVRFALRWLILFQKFIIHPGMFRS